MIKNKATLFKMILAFVFLFGIFGGTANEVLAAPTTGAPTDLPYLGDAKDKITAPDEGVNGTAMASIVNTMYTFAKYISGLIFGVAVIMIVWAGFKYATSQGETKVTEQAKMQIITAGIGIGVALLAMIITKVFVEIFDTAKV